MFRFLRRSDYRDRYTDRPKPKVPDPRDAPNITGDLKKSLDYFTKTAGRSSDFKIRLTDINRREVAIAFYLSIVDETVVENIIKSIQNHDFPKHISLKEMPYYLARHVMTSGNVVIMENLWELREALARGHAILMVEGLSAAITIGAESIPHRAPNTPLLESSTRGPQVAFTEDLNTNLALVRRSLVGDTLTIKELVVGYRSRTRIAVVYEEDVANPTLLDTVIKRIEAVHVDKLTGSATLEQRIVDNHWTIFPLTRATTRLDNCIKEIGQGKVLILVDGDPTGLMVPGTIMDFFQTMEDDQHGYVDATLVRWLRALAYNFAIFVPALYISFTDFNPELLPHTLALQIAKSREGVPFSAAIEVSIMQVVIEIIREAALRMPKVMGQTIGIVGGLVLGQAAVEAGIVSNILIVIVALTAVSIFVIPSYEFSAILRIISWMNIVGASLFGIYGVLLVSVGVLYHVASLKSFGSNYMTPVNGEHFLDFILDGFIRFPIPMLDKRAAHLHTQESTRAADYTNPVGHPLMERPSQDDIGNNNRRMKRRD